MSIISGNSNGNSNDKLNIIQNVRNDIIKTNNTATQQLQGIIESQQKNISELNLPDGMNGDLDLSIITNNGFSRVTTINIGKGNITELLNIPSSVIKLYCPDNLLTELSNIPKHIRELNINNNHITTLDLKDLNTLTILNCSNNNIIQIENLPESIVEIHCDNNNILNIDLLNLYNIRKLNITGNSENLTILNIPSSLDELEYDQNKMVTISHIPNDKQNPNKRFFGNNDGESGGGDTSMSNRNYLLDLNEYFKIKKIYEINYKEKKKKVFNSALLKGNTIKTSKKIASSIMPVCINCSAAGGTKFRKMEGKYSAICNGLKKKCNLNIKIFTGVHYNFDDLFQEYSKELEKTKQEIIIQKMDTLFNYIKDEITADKFKRVLKEYSDKNEIFRDLTINYKLLNDNEHKRELINKKMEIIYSIIDRMDNIHKIYHKELDLQLLKDMMYIKVKELDPEILALRQLKYELCEMNINDCNIEELFQRENSLLTITYSFDELPHTIKYIKK